MKAYAGKKILMLVENLPYPDDVRVRHETTTLAEAGYQVSVICPSKPGLSWRENLDGVLVYRYPNPFDAHNSTGYIFEYGFSLLAMFVLSILVWIKPGFDIIHAANPPDTAVFIAAFYKVFGKRFVFDHHDLAPEMYWIRFEGNGHNFVHSLLIGLEKLSLRLADLVIATNRSYKLIEMQRGKVPEERITIVRNGPDLNRLRLVNPDPKLKEKSKIIIGYVGEMSFQDGINHLLKALYHLINDLGKTDFFCVVIGKGNALQNMKILAQELKLDDYIWFTGYIPDEDLVRLLSTADICVDPDPSNPFNDRCTMVKMMEYMAMEKPIVAFDLPEHHITAQEAALYARPNDESDFAHKIATLMDNPQLRVQMGHYGRKRIENELAWSHQKDALLKGYQKMLATP